MPGRAATAAVILSLAACPAALAEVAQPHGLKAELVQPTDRYDHAVFGDALEWGGLHITAWPCADCGADGKTFTLPETAVFEDIAARVLDLDGDGSAEVLVVETRLTQGASLAIYNASGKIAATPYIGRARRWLAPAGLGDFDGDGTPEIAYIDRPHLLRDVVFLRYRDRRLTEIARLPGLTNHRFGDPLISGGVRNCGAGDELVLANADWTEIMAVRLDGTAPRSLGPLNSPADFARALNCEA